MNWKEQAKKLKTDIPALFLALKDKDTPNNIIERNRKSAKGLWENGKPKKWYYAIPIIVIRLLIMILVIQEGCFRGRAAPYG